MIVVTGEQLLDRGLRGGAIALGNFDGVHLGHQAVIGAAVATARKRGIPALVGTFAPHPARFFQPGRPPFALTSLDQKLELLAGLGVDATIVIPFTKSLAGLSAEGFATTWLAGNFGVSFVATGGDFTFGKGRTGSVALLRQLGEKLGFENQVVAPVAVAGEIVSSTRIRQLLEEGDARAAAELLTRPFAIRAPVLHGDRLGRTIGFPTTNQELGAYQRPRYGVYAVEVVLPGGGVQKGVANLGVRPMFDPPRELLETYILDWKGDLYGQTIEVRLIRWLRGEEKLADMAALKTRIDEDIRNARAAFAPPSEGAAPDAS